MKIHVTNIEQFEWEIPDELMDLKEKENLTFQDLVNKYFDTEDIGVYKETDDYYEITSI